jgi:hypothetical protein
MVSKFIDHLAPRDVGRQRDATEVVATIPERGCSRAGAVPGRGYRGWLDSAARWLGDIPVAWIGLWSHCESSASQYDWGRACSPLFHLGAVGDWALPLGRAQGRPESSPCACGPTAEGERECCHATLTSGWRAVVFSAERTYSKRQGWRARWSIPDNPRRIPASAALVLSLWSQ